jgi:hypothetical protein
MAGSFARDGNCVALYKFDDDTLDSKGNNDLTNFGVSFSVTKKEGEKSGLFELANKDHCDIDYASLDSGFPGKYGETLAALSIAVWVRFVSASLTAQICGLYNGLTANRSWTLRRNNTTNSFSFSKGYNSGASYETYNHPYTGVTTGVWYHVEVSYLESTKSILFGVWDDGYGGYRQDGANDFAGSTYANFTAIVDEQFTIGRQSSDDSAYVDGYLDELVIFKDIVSASEFAAIRNQTYGMLPPLFKKTTKTLSRR